MKVPEKAKDEIMQFQQIQQQIQILLMQKQNIQIQQAEFENALKEMEKAKESEVFEVIGNIMLKKPKKELSKSLKEKKELLDLRMSTIDKQTEALGKKANELQKKLSKYIEEEK